jgi:hypothetical protein
MTEERQFAILFAVMLLAAPKLIDLDPPQAEHGEGLSCEMRQWCCVHPRTGTDRSAMTCSRNFTCGQGIKTCEDGTGIPRRALLG